MSSYGENKKESTHFHGLLPFKHGINNIFTRKKDHQYILLCPSKSKMW